MTEPPIARITAEIRARYWDLPGQLAKRRRDAHNTYMRSYMREVYRPARRRIDVTLSQAQYDAVQRAARRSGRPVTVYFREAAFAYLEQRYLVPTAIEQTLHVLVYQLRAAGNNLNQLAHHANTKRRATAEDVRQAREILITMETAVTGFVRTPPLLSDRG